jgi:membrane protein
VTTSSTRGLQATRSFVRGLRAHDGLEAAAAIAFWFFLSFVPLLVLLGFLVGQVARSRGIDALVGPLLDVVPGSAEELVRKEIERLAGSGVSLAPLGVAGYFWTASSGLHNLMDVFETAARVRRRPWWKQRAIALGWVVLGLATACVIAWLLVRIDGVLHAHEASAHEAVRAAAHGAIRRRMRKALHTPTEEAFAVVLALLLGTVFLAGFYRFAVEHPQGVRRRVWPGTITAVVCWLVVSWAFGEYVSSLADYALYYGSLAAVAVMLVWLYLTSLSLVLGAEVNAQLEAAVRRRAWAPPGGRRESARAARRRRPARPARHRRRGPRRAGQSSR